MDENKTQKKALNSKVKSTSPEKKEDLKNQNNDLSKLKSAQFVVCQFTEQECQIIFEALGEIPTKYGSPMQQKLTQFVIAARKKESKEEEK